MLYLIDMARRLTLDIIYSSSSNESGQRVGRVRPAADSNVEFDSDLGSDIEPLDSDEEPDFEEEDEVDELEKGDAVDDTVNDGVGAFGEGEFDVAGESDEESEAHRAVPPSSAYTSDAGM